MARSNQNNVKKHRHKRSTAAEKRRRKRWEDPDEQEVKIRELNRLMRQEIQRLADEDGEIAGPLSVVARYVTPTILKDFDIAETEAPAFEHWLLAKLGDQIRDPDIAGFLAWRERARELVA